MKRGYTKNVLWKAFNRAMNSSREQLLYNEKVKDISSDIVLFITPYSDQRVELKNTLQQHRHILMTDSKTRKCIPSQIQITFKKPPSLKDNLVSSHFKGQSALPHCESHTISKCDSC